jgi:nucleoid DNA-binding protein
MAKAKKSAAASHLLKKADKAYTKSALIAHLAEKVSAGETGAISKKQVTAVLDELVGTMFQFAAVGATLPGVGRLILKKTAARPARKGRNPKTGEEITIAAKKPGKKLVFRVSKAAKQTIGL